MLTNNRSIVFEENGQKSHIINSCGYLSIDGAVIGVFVQTTAAAAPSIAIISKEKERRARAFPQLHHSQCYHPIFTKKAKDHKAQCKKSFLWKLNNTPLLNASKPTKISVANSLCTKIGYWCVKNREIRQNTVGVPKSAKNRPYFWPIFPHFLTPMTLFIAFLSDNFFFQKLRFDEKR